MAFTRVAALLHTALSDVVATQHHTATVAGDLNHQDLAARGVSDHHVATVAGDLALSGLATRAHADLSDAPAAAHHTKYTDAEAIAAAIVRTTVTEETRAAAAATGDVSYTGAGFVPTGYIIFGVEIDDLDGLSWGFVDDSGTNRLTEVRDVNGTPMISVTTRAVQGFDATTSHGQGAIHKSFDADGITLTWTKTGDGRRINFTILYLR